MASSSTSPPGLQEVLEDLCARFIINLPPEELSCKSRLGFQVEQAFWFYEDFHRCGGGGGGGVVGPNPNNSINTNLPKLTLKAFGTRLLAQCPLDLSGILGPEGVEGLVDEFYQYKAHVPTCGAIVLNQSLDKGKIAKEELPSQCAIREVLEETGFDISARLRDEDFLQIENNDQPIRLYLIPAVSESTRFEPMTRREIRDIQWHRISDIRYEQSTPHRYFNVMPFMSKLKAWIKRYRRMHNLASSSHPTPSPITQNPQGREHPDLVQYHPPDEVDPHYLSLANAIDRKLAPLRQFKLDLGRLYNAYLTAIPAGKQ